MIAAQHLKNLRLIHNYTQDHLAFELDVSQKTYSNMETGKTKISVDHLFKLAQLYNTDVVSILEQLTTVDVNTLSNIRKEHSDLSELDLFNGVNVKLSIELITQLKERIKVLNEIIEIKNVRIEELENNIPKS